MFWHVDKFQVFDTSQSDFHVLIAGLSWVNW